MKLRYTMLAATIACALPLFGAEILKAQESETPQIPKGSVQQPENPAEQDSTSGYPVRNRRIGGPTDVEWDLDDSFPKRGSVLEMILRCPDSEHK
jgi:hypothetical protein